MEQMPALRRNVKAEDMPALYKRAFERELDRVILAQFHEPGRVDDHLAFNRHYARYFTLLATEPHLLDGSLEAYQELRERGVSQADADSLTTATRRPSRLARMWLSVVVLPAPRKPESTVTGRRDSFAVMSGTLTLML